MAVNNIPVEPNGIWEHIKTGHQILVIKVVNDDAYCALMDGTRVSKKRVVIPVKKIKFWGNRGFGHIRVRKGKGVKFGKAEQYGAYNPRNAELGAI